MRGADMRHTRWIVGALATVGILAAGAGAANADSRGPRSEETVTAAIRFSDDPVDVGPSGPSAGDELVLHDTLVDARGRVIGHDGGVCTFTDLSAPELSCVVTFSLPRGQITTQFLNTPPPHKVGAITGGTGAYRDARGHFELTENPDQTGVIVFRIRH
jgi:hypothetical protein